MDATLHPPRFDPIHHHACAVTHCQQNTPVFVTEMNKALNDTKTAAAAISDCSLGPSELDPVTMLCLKLPYSNRVCENEVYYVQLN